ncbi:MAG: glycogen-debranching protein, partial [Myxococcales bacterium]|nr:glycogen-debranching protein [Myxococcales bacterium]
AIELALGRCVPRGTAHTLEFAPDAGQRPGRPLRDQLVYEVHLRGLTRGDADAGACAGTYAAAATRAADLAALGVTAVELLPVQETWNDRNDVVPDDAGGDNYWGYSTLAFLAPDRRYACDRSPGGPTREVAAMVRAFHDHGVEVWLDVVYNHTAEGGGSSLLSLRGLDNAGYYQLDRAGTGFTDHTGVGADVDVRQPAAADLVLDSLRWWHDVLGVDGFRFDLASVLGNACGPGCFDFRGDGLLTRIADELPARGGDGGDGAVLVAEPWGIGAGTYQLGHFPAGWAEWNGAYRDLIRDDQNRLDVADVTPGWLADRIAGSPDLFADDGRAPWSSIDFVVSHDGFTLRDLYACSAKANDQPWPYGPSGGGDDQNRSWDQAGDPARQRQAARTGLALLMLSAGVPMITGGDEAYRTQGCNNNPYNLDSPAIWLDPADRVDHAGFVTFARRLMQFRAAHPALRPATWWGDAEVSWHTLDGGVATGGYLDDPGNHFLGWRVRGNGDAARSIYVAYNGLNAPLQATLPAPAADARWYRVADTGAWMEPQDNSHAPGDEYPMQGRRYDLAARSLALFVER